MLLLRARTPVTYREVREQFPGYQTANAEAGLRAFERDKADLLELGVPIRYITPEASLRDGIASNNPVTVRALVYILAGHTLYHLADLHEKYLAGLDVR